jgi:hypothetical protein
VVVVVVVVVVVTQVRVRGATLSYAMVDDFVVLNNTTAP